MKKCNRYVGRISTNRFVFLVLEAIVSAVIAVCNIICNIWSDIRYPPYLHQPVPLSTASQRAPANVALSELPPTILSRTFHAHIPVPRTDHYYMYCSVKQETQEEVCTDPSSVFVPGKCTNNGEVSQYAARSPSSSSSRCALGPGIVVIDTKTPVEPGR